ncbi:HlyD family efflux transporter periplasmic adaptor subunit [Frigoriglobus tundricola]|uniref:High-affnity carbon uptake protein Hat/HatR n=1 Tax=Frigoriglobus tundricola TaxID=2774151 RepID=A0A6M5YR78_9BACT|nr:HlyD family efflux transporter periplasmic adaptor subunit [Frigoriglobus tundricola]QJW96468.1 High-affnity carbon uptake protein Hat/HatR [Frigoriglobus tundricola]
MRLRSLALMSALAAMTGLLIGCSSKPPTTEKSNPTGSAQPEARNVDVGPPLYAAVSAPVYTTVIARGEPVVISNALVQYEERQVISAEVDGTIDLFATPISPEEARKLVPGQLLYHPRDVKKEFPLRRIGESDEVTDGQILAYLDEQQVRARLDGAKKIIKAALSARESAEVGADAAKERLALSKEAARGVAGSGSKKEILDDQLTFQRFVENLAQAQQTIAKAEQDLAESTVLLGKHQVKGRVNGVVRSLAKRPGEYVKAGDKIMEVEATDRVRIEGNLDVQYMSRVHRGMTVVVEPAVPSAPITSHQGHRQPVTGLAVTAHPDGPLVVSAGADGGALVWDPNLGKKDKRPTLPHNLPHPVAVRSVAATPPTAKSLMVITGADDGKIRIWDVSNRAALPTTPKAEPEEVHTSGVQAIAVSPDGLYFATAAGRDVFVWELATAKKLYALPVEHRDNVTAVNFTPQNTLVTASKDGTIKVWKLGTERAAVVRTLDHRAGAVEVLGVSRDGSRVLFDQDKTRIDLVDPANGQTTGQVQNVTSAGAFSTVAAFGPDEVPPGTPADKLPPYTIATAGGDGDLKGTLQYWMAPRTGGRGAEAGRLIIPGRAGITAVAFSPVRSEPFLVVGTAAGGVFLWKPPAGERKTHTGRVTFTDPTDTRYLTVRVEMDNKELKLTDHSTATIIVPSDR